MKSRILILAMTVAAAGCRQSATPPLSTSRPITLQQAMTGKTSPKPVADEAVAARTRQSHAESTMSVAHRQPRVAKIETGTPTATPNPWVNADRATIDSPTADELKNSPAAEQAAIGTPLVPSALPRDANRLKIAPPATSTAPSSPDQKANSLSRREVPRSENSDNRRGDRLELTVGERREGGFSTNLRSTEISSSHNSAQQRPDGGSSPKLSITGDSVTGHGAQQCYDVSSVTALSVVGMSNIDPTDNHQNSGSSLANVLDHLAAPDAHGATAKPGSAALPPTSTNRPNSQVQPNALQIRLPDASAPANPLPPASESLPISSTDAEQRRQRLIEQRRINADRDLAARDALDRSVLDTLTGQPTATPAHPTTQPTVQWPWK